MLQYLEFIKFLLIFLFVFERIIQTLRNNRMGMANLIDDVLFLSIFKSLTIIYSMFDFSFLFA